MIVYEKVYAHWLEQLEKKQGVSALLGTNFAPSLAVCQNYTPVQDVGVGRLAVECSLLGEPGIDLSVTYPVAKFTPGCLQPSFKYIEELCAVYLESFPKQKSNRHFCLETDVHSGAVEKSALFLPVEKHIDKSIFQKAGIVEQGNAVINFLTTRASSYRPNWIGFMLSRPDTPIRVALRGHPKAELTATLDYLESLGGFTIDAVLRNSVLELCKIYGCDLFVDIDIMPNGRLGPVLGLELLLPVTKFVHQLLIITSPPAQSFMKRLVELGLADKRIYATKECIWDEVIMQKVIFVSRISHFKLRWYNGLPMPAKVYLGAAFAERGIL